jgi:hypothetical protein
MNIFIIKLLVNIFDKLLGGFAKGQSAISNSIEYSSFVLNNIKDGWQVDSVYTENVSEFNYYI